MQTYDPVAFAAVVTEELERRGLDYTKLAALLDRVPATVWRQMSGKRRVHKNTVDRYAQALGISPASFFARMRQNVHTV